MKGIHFINYLLDALNYILKLPSLEHVIGPPFIPGPAAKQNRLAVSVANLICHDHDKSNYVVMYVISFVIKTNKL